MYFALEYYREDEGWYEFLYPMRLKTREQAERELKEFIDGLEYQVGQVEREKYRIRGSNEHM